ncbi:MAG: hypothetical protein ACFFG0_18110, partial [Candidatus Thorarchaeota archaeon]
IFLSNQQKNEYDLREEFSEYNITIIDCNDIKKNVKSEIIEILKTNKIVFNRERIYFFLDANILTLYQIKLLFSLYYNIDLGVIKKKDRDHYNIIQKDIYLMNIGKHYDDIKKIYTLKNKYKNYFMDYSIKEENLFFKTLKQILCMIKNRKIIDYDKANIPISYILKMMEYNSIRTKDINSIIKNTNLISNLYKYMYMIDNKIIQKIINESFNPLYIRNLSFPKKVLVREIIKNIRKFYKKLPIKEYELSLEYSNISIILKEFGKYIFVFEEEINVLYCYENNIYIYKEGLWEKKIPKVLNKKNKDKSKINLKNYKEYVSDDFINKLENKNIVKESSMF